MQIGRIAPSALILTLLPACLPSADDQALDVDQAVFASRSAGAVQLAETLSMQHLLETEPALLDGVETVATKRVYIDGLGQAHTRMTQSVAGISVFGAHSVVHMNEDGSLKGMTDGFVRHIQVDTKPAISVEDATSAAAIATGGWQHIQRTFEPALHILRHQGKDYLTYRVRLERVDADGVPSIPVAFVDAHTSELVWSYNDLKTARNRKTYADSGQLPGTLIRDESSTPSGDAEVDEAHLNAGYTYDYYFNNHGRDSFDANGATITSTVHYGSNYVNAFWDGTQMVYGDGDGVDSGPLTVLDVVGHELTHAVTDYSSDLIYANESGALNEGMSDIFGASIEAYRDGAVSLNTWKIGEECWTPGTAGDALRYMHDPQEGGDYDYYPTRYVGSSDNGGVHWNSGIANLAFYLAVEGGTHPRGATSNVVPMLDPADVYNSLDKGAAIFYRANTVYLTPSSTFADARAATKKAAEDLYGAGSAEVAAIESAWTAVGVEPPPDYVVIDSKSDLSGASGTEDNYTYDTTSSTTAIKFVMSGGSGDADLYVKFGSAPTTSSYDCRPYALGNNELCEFNPAQSGTYYVMIRAFSSYSGVALTVSAAGDGGSTPVEICTDGIDNDNDGAVDCADSDCSADAACQPSSSGVSVGDLDGVSTSLGRGQWRASVSVLAVDGTGNAVADATVTGAWSGGTTGSSSCVTGSNGRCLVDSSSMRNRNGTATFTVSDVTHGSLSYDSSANSDPDGDSDGTSIVVAK